MTTSLVTAASARSLSAPRLQAALKVSGTSLIAQALDAENIAAYRMTDGEFWAYDQVWYTNPDKARYLDVRIAGMCGGGGCNTTFNNNQFWQINEPCSKGLFAFVLFQQRRYMAAQKRLRALLANAPQPEILAGFDRYAANPIGGVRRACNGVSTQAKAGEWAAWATEVLRVVGAARWATNFSWSESSHTVAEVEAPTLAAVAARPTGGGMAGCSYIPDCSADEYGVTTLGYICGDSTRGLKRFESLPQPPALARGAHYPSLVADRLPRITSAFATSGVADGSWPISIASQVLGLHRGGRVAPAVSEVIPTGADAFVPMLRSWAQTPGFLAQPATGGVPAFLQAAFAETPGGVDGPLFAKVLYSREDTGLWLWRSAQGFDRVAWGSERWAWFTAALAREVVDTSFGQCIIDGFVNLDATLQRIPNEWRTGPLSEAMAAVSAAATALSRTNATTVGAVMGGAAAVVGAIVPVLGIILAALGALMSWLTMAQVNLGLTRRGNPVALQFPVMRVAPIDAATGEDRCWINPGPNETLNNYGARVTSPYAESALRTGGDAARMFDEIARVRAERAGLVPDEPPPEESGKPWAWGAAGLAAGFIAIRLIAGV